MGSPNRTQTLNDPIVATIDTYIRKTPADVIFNRNLLLSILWGSRKEKGVAGPSIASKVKTPRVFTQAGRNFMIPVNQARSTNGSTFRGEDLLATAIDTGITAQFAIPAYYQDYAAISWTEQKENEGPSAVVSIWQSRVDRAFATLAEDLETDLFSANADTSATQKGVIGLRTLVSTVTTDTVWGIDRNTYTWQRNNASTSAGSFATNGLDKFRSMLTDCSGTSGVDRPHLIVTTPDVWEYAVKQLEAIHRITNEQASADLSFPAVMYQGIPITYSSSCPSGYAYFLNLDYWRLIKTPGADFDTVYPTAPNDQLIDKQVRIIWGGNWGCERFDRQGVISGFTA